MPNLPFMETAFEVNITNNARKKKNNRNRRRNVKYNNWCPDAITCNLDNETRCRRRRRIHSGGSCCCHWNECIQGNYDSFLGPYIFGVCVASDVWVWISHTHTQLLLLVSTSFKLCQSALQFQCDTGALPTITFNSLWVVAATAGPFAQTQNNKSRYARTLRSMNAILALEFLCFWCYKLHVVWPMHFHSPH